MKRIIIGISGASGAVLGIELLKAFQSLDEWETHLVISDTGEFTIREETSFTPEEVRALADHVYSSDDLAAAISSGTFRTEGMVIIPCSMKTAAGIASGYSDNLLLRAADVTLKEGRKLILVARESPLSLIHLKNLELLAQCGAVILPPVVSFYTKPETIQDIIDQIVGRVLNSLGIDSTLLKRWTPDGK